MDKDNLKSGIFLMTLSSLLTVIGQLLWKFGAEANTVNDFILIFIGFACYGFGSLLMIYALKFGELSILYPVMSTSYIFAIIIGYFYLNEAINIYKIIGTLIILLGVALIGRGDDLVDT